MIIFNNGSPLICLYLMLEHRGVGAGGDACISIGGFLRHTQSSEHCLLNSLGCQPSPASHEACEV